MRTLPALCLAAVSVLSPAAFAASPAPGPIGQPERIHVVRSIAELTELTGLPMGASTLLAVPVEQGEEILEVTRFTNLTDDAQVVAVGEGGVETPIDLSRVVLLKGTIAGDPDSLAFVSISDHQVSGFIRAVDGVRVISSGAPDADAAIHAALMRDLRLGDGNPTCAVQSNDPAFYPPDAPPRRPAADAPFRGEPPCRVARIAIDTDYPLTATHFGGNPTLAAVYVQTLMAASSSIYERDLNVRLTIPYMRLWTTSDTPYAGMSNANHFLDRLRDHWNEDMGHIERETVHGLSSLNLGGGVAYVNALCYRPYAYGISGNLDGSFPLPVQDNSHDNWDLMVVSHELGHNFGTGHTHDSYNPPIDGCGNGDCANAFDTTIMSYCHLCPGGISNMDMRFHPRVQARILQFLGSEAGCNLIAAAEPVALDDQFQVLAGDPTDLNVLANDASASCDSTPVTITGFPTQTQAGGTLELVTDAMFTHPLLRYTAPAGFVGTDVFTYAAGEAGEAEVSVQVVTARAPVTGVITEPGVEVDYYTLSNPSSMPDFDLRTPYASDVVNAVNFESTTGNFATSGRSDNVGAVFNGLIEVPETGWYTLSVESDDGSLLYVGDDLVVDNDGLHGMVEASAQVALQAGKHPVRVEFFEAGGGAGVIVRYAGDAVTRRPVPASAWSRVVGQACPADLAAPFGQVDIMDMLHFVTAFSHQLPSADVAPPFGHWDIFDLMTYLDMFNAGCP